MRKLGLVYMLLVRNLDTKELYIHTSGRASTPFATFNIGSAKAVRTRILKGTTNKECSIITVNINDSSALVDLNLFSF